MPLFIIMAVLVVALLGVLYVLEVRSRRLRSGLGNLAGAARPQSISSRHRDNDDLGARATMRP
ncbi:hypothetical protein ACTG9Q_31575 [Actinokineospora sp. 24-640]